MASRNITHLNRLFYILEAAVVIPLGTLVSFLPWKMRGIFGTAGGNLAFYLNKKDKRWAYENLDIIFADAPLSKRAKDRIVKRLFVNIATGAFEYFKIGRVNAHNYHQFVQLDNYDALTRALGQKKGLLAITAHFGNWEYLGSVPAKLGLNVGSVIRSQYNPYTDKWLKNIREKKGKVKCFYNTNSLMLHITKHLKQNGALAILADQTYLSKKIFVPFFGRKSATTDGPAKLHLWYDVPIVFCASLKQEDGRYLLVCDGPHHFEKSGNMRRDCERIMTWVNQRYEKLIRKHPDQWFSLLTPRWEEKEPKNAKDLSASRVSHPDTFGVDQRLSLRQKGSP